ncbi:MAG: M20/M25/M40 family metallo-hydrolase [Pirellulales bacterium]|nr:M20/M25/M40 family metallo-hydrolase [Pirellulales bacterium]
MNGTPPKRVIIFPGGILSGGPAVVFFIALVCSPAPAADLGRPREQTPAAVEARLKETVGYLASDELRGRSPGTKEIDLAADYIVKRMTGIGLKTDLFQGTPFQHFRARVRNFQAENRSHWPGLLDYVGRRVYDMHRRQNGSSPARPAVKEAAPFPSGPVEMKNVVAMLEGAGPLAEETIVVGAHYDHLGVQKNLAGQWEIYNGANDNASGVAVMLETAEILARRPKRLPRRVVFVAFSGEESGLLGSFHYVSDPPVPLEKTIAMINLDMVGSLQGEMLIALGTSTSSRLAKLANRSAKRHQLRLLKIPFVLAGSDHVPFYAHRVPVVFFVTRGGRADYHRPTDDPEKLNYPGMRRIAAVTADLASALAEADRRPEFAKDGPISILVRYALRLWSRISGN